MSDAPHPFPAVRDALNAFNSAARALAEAFETAEAEASGGYDDVKGDLLANGFAESYPLLRSFDELVPEIAEWATRFDTLRAPKKA